MRVALVSREGLPEWEVDDAALVDAFEARGVEVSRPAWSDPAVDWAGVDAALLRTPWDYQERLDAFLGWAARAAAVTRLLNPLEVVRWNTRKTYLAELAGRGVPVAPTLWARRGERVDLAAWLDAGGWARGFFKPVVGSTAVHTARFGRDEVTAAEEALTAHLRVRDMIVQPYLRSVETEGELSVIVIDGEPTHAVRKVPLAGDYRVQDDFGATDGPIPLSAELAALAARALEAASLCLGQARPLLYARVDALRGPEGLVLNELEVVEPSLFFRHGRHAAARLAEATLARIR